MGNFNPFGLFTGVWIPDFLLSYSGISPAAKICYARLCRYCGRKTNECFPSIDELAGELGVTTRSVSSYLKELEEDGFIIIERRGLQMTNLYSLQRNQVIDDFLSGTLSDQDRKNPSDQDMKNSSDPDMKNPSGPSIELKRVNIRESLEENTLSEFSSSERISEERLTPDVETVQYSDLNEIELPYEGLKSKTQMSTSEIRSFWTRWNRATRLTPDAREKQRSKFWVASLAFEQAETAVAGYPKIASEYSIDDFKKRYWESYKAGMSQERAESVPFVRTQQTTGHTSPIEPGAPWGPAQAILRWNELVVSRPITDWDSRLDSQGLLLKACSEPSFVDNFDDLCRRCEAAIMRTDSNWLTFRWLFKQSSGQPVNWWRILKGSLDSIPKERKAKPTLEESQSNVMKILMEGK